MAAEFEIYIASKKYPSIKMCETIFPIVGKVNFQKNVLFEWLAANKNEDVLYTAEDEQIDRVL